MLGDFTINGLNVTSANVGDTIKFLLPGYDQVWLEQAQNGRTQWSGPLTIPFQYQFQLSDVGYYQGAAYEISPTGARGAPITSWTFTVKGPGGTIAPQTLGPIITPPAPGQGPASGLGPIPITGPTIIEQPSGAIGLEQPAAEEVTTSDLFGLDQKTVLLMGGAVLLLILLNRGDNRR